MKILWMKNQCLQDEGVDCSFGCMRAFVWVPNVPNGVPLRSHRVDRGKGLGVDG